MITVIIITVAGLILGIWLNAKDIGFMSGFLLMILCGALLFFEIIALPASRIDYQNDLRKLNAFEQTINSARSDSTSFIERAALTQEVAKWNEWIAQATYWNNTIFDIYIPDECANKQPIK